MQIKIEIKYLFFINCAKLKKKAGKCSSSEDVGKQYTYFAKGKTNWYSLFGKESWEFPSDGHILKPSTFN